MADKFEFRRSKEMKIEKIGRYEWLAYPVVVLVAMLILVTQVVFPSGTVSNLRRAWTEIEEKRAVVERLRTRITVLEKVGEGEADEDLKKLFLIMPASKELLPIISGLRTAAGKSGVLLEGYNAVGGEIKGGGGGQNLRVDVSVAGSWSAVLQFIQETERQLPLRRVTEVSLIAGKSRVVVEGRWAPLAKVVDLEGKDVPDYRGRLDEVMAAVAGYEMPGVASESGAVGGGINSSLF